MAAARAVTRVTSLLKASPMMSSMGVALLRATPGQTILGMNIAAHMCQQDGFLHAGM